MKRRPEFTIIAGPNGTVISSLMKEKEEAISQNKNFAFETNFSTDLPVNLVQDFKDAGYKISLTYRFGGYKAKQHEEVDTSRFGK